MQKSWYDKSRLALKLKTLPIFTIEIMKIYCLSGLGADKKAFQNIHIKGATLVHIEWLSPLPKETMASYAKRLYEENIVEDDYYLMGLSFGGMLAQEFSKIHQPKRLILLSTIPSSGSLPIYLRFLGKLRFHHILPNRVIKSVNFITRYLFGTQDPRVEKLFRQIQADTDPKYIRWAIGTIVNWKNSVTVNALRVHGSKDKLLPLKFEVDHIVQGGGHLMLIDHSEEVNKAISEYLA